MYLEIYTDILSLQSLDSHNPGIKLVSGIIDDSSSGIGNLVIAFRKRIGTFTTFWKGNYCVILYFPYEPVALVADDTFGIVQVQARTILYLLIAAATFLASDIEPIAALLVTKTI